MDAGPTSCMAGGFFAAPGETWPANENGLMLPIIQIVTSELPLVPKHLSDIALLTVFMDRRNLPPDSDAPNGEGWLLRSYARQDELVPLASPSELWAGEFPKDRWHRWA